jgi:hypothetical protein
MFTEEELDIFDHAPVSEASSEHNSTMNTLQHEPPGVQIRVANCTRATNKYNGQHNNQQQFN